MTGVLLAVLIMAAPAAAALTWTNTPMPAASVGWQGEDAAVFSPSNAFMVGSSSNGTGLIAHYNGAAWSQTLALVKPSEFRAATTTPQGTAFAVGEYQNLAAGTESALAEHFDGSVWRITSTPALAGTDLVEFDGVAATSDTNAWLVGLKRVTGEYRTLAEHWNGTRWTVVTTPNPDTTSFPSNELRKVSVGSDGVVFALGDYGGGTQLLLERTGSTWKRLTLPALPFDAGFYGIAAVNMNSVYLVGGYVDTASGHGRPLVYHWNGTSFARVAATNPAAWDESYMTDVTVSPRGAVYASGLAYQDTGGPIDQTGEVWRIAAGRFTPMDPNAPVDSAFWGIDAKAGAAFVVGDESGVPHPTAAAMKLVG